MFDPVKAFRKGYRIDTNRLQRNPDCQRQPRREKLPWSKLIRACNSVFRSGHDALVLFPNEEWIGHLDNLAPL